MTRDALSKQEFVKALERRSPRRVPMMLHFWNSPAAFKEREAAVRAIQEEYPNDANCVGPVMPSVWEDPKAKDYLPNYSWTGMTAPAGWASAGHDGRVAIRDWAQLDEVLAGFPDPNRPEIFVAAREGMGRSAGRYNLMVWWFCLYERVWSMRGMENVLVDFYENPGPLHRLMDALTEFYVALIRRSGRELGVDGVFTSDDIGMQTGPMFSREIFDEFFKPRYARIIRAAHEHNMHFWLHTCGDVRAFLDDFVAMGLDVIHPIQKYTMDEREVAQRFGGKIAFWCGMDVQRILPRGTPEDVRREVRFMIDTYDRPGGGCIVTAGNDITNDVPLENLRAFYDETYNYGLAHRRKF